MNLIIISIFIIIVIKIIILVNIIIKLLLEILLIYHFKSTKQTFCINCTFPFKSIKKRFLLLIDKSKKREGVFYLIY
jgi:hypothetical protein